MKKRVYELWKKRKATQEDDKDVMRLCRDKIRSGKAPVELNIAVVKESKKCFSKYINKERGKRKYVFYWMWWGET